jgi:SAM-dependent methyltransferase
MIELHSAIFPATAMPDQGWWQALWPHPEDTVSAIGVMPGMRIVDLCCGDGWFTLPITRIAREVIAIDLDPHMLELTRTALVAANIRNCELVEGDAYDVDRLVDEPADFVLMANTFHGVPDKTRLAIAMAAALKPGGKLAIINWHRRPREQTTVLGEPRGPRTDMRMAPADVAVAVTPAGLKLLDVVELAPYHYAAIFTKPSASHGVRS